MENAVRGGFFFRQPADSRSPRDTADRLYRVDGGRRRPRGAYFASEQLLLESATGT